MKPENKVKNVKENSKKIPKKRGNSTLIIGIVAVILLTGIAYAVLSGDSICKLLRAKALSVYGCLGFL